MLEHVRRNAVAYLALLVALTGTSYAAIRLPSGSVGEKQLKKAAVTRAKLHSKAVDSKRVKDHSLMAIDFAANQLPQGEQGEQGERGLRGLQGLQGEPGPPGPTYGVAGIDTGCCAAAAPDAAAFVDATKNVTLPHAGPVFVIGREQIGVTNCPPGPSSCSRTVGLRVDGVGLPGSAATVTAVPGSSSVSSLSPFGITGNLTAGAHTINLVSGGTSNGAGGFSGQQQIAVIALGG